MYLASTVKSDSSAKINFPFSTIMVLRIGVLTSTNNDIPGGT